MIEMTQSEYARLRGFSDSYVSKLKRQGRIVFSRPGFVNVDATNRLIENTRAPARGLARASRQATLARCMAPQSFVVIPTEIVNRFAMETDPRRIRRMLAAEFRDVIEQVAERILSPCAMDARPAPAGAKASVYNTSE